MTKPIHTVITLAAAMILGGGTLLMGANPEMPGQPAPPPGSPAANINAPAGQQAAGQTIVSDLHQFAQDPKTAPDKLFVLNAYCDSSMEVSLSRQALSKTQDGQIKNLANQMIDDHTKLNSKLQTLAGQMGVDLPQGTPEMKQAEMDVLGSLSGKDYDQQFLATMNADHAKAIACFKFAAANAMNPQLKQLASDTVPTLEHHREMVQQTASACGVNLGENEATPAGAQMHGESPAPAPTR